MLDRVAFVHEGHRYRAESASGNVSAGGPARPSNAQWYVTIDDQPEDIAFDAGPDDTESAVKTRIIEWDRVRRLPSTR
jgi:hypothetical protein